MAGYNEYAKMESEGFISDDHDANTTTTTATTTQEWYPRKYHKHVVRGTILHAVL